MNMLLGNKRIKVTGHMIRVGLCLACLVRSRKMRRAKKIQAMRTS